MFLIRDVLVGCGSNGVWVLEEPTKQTTTAATVLASSACTSDYKRRAAPAKLKKALGVGCAKQRMTVILESILLLLVGCSSLTDGASKLLQKY